MKHCSPLSGLIYLFFLSLIPLGWFPTSWRRRGQRRRLGARRDGSPWLDACHRRGALHDVLLDENRDDLAGREAPCAVV